MTARVHRKRKGTCKSVPYVHGRVVDLQMCMHVGVGQGSVLCLASLVVYLVHVYRTVPIPYYNHTHAYIMHMCKWVGFERLSCDIMMEEWKYSNGLTGQWDGRVVCVACYTWLV